MSQLSVIIITKNAAKHMLECLNSVAFADDIIVFDGGSQDNTVNICRQFTDKIVIDTDWQGFGIQKNQALAQATGEWVLSIDADEHVPPQLMLEIQQAMQQQDYVAFEIPRLSRYCGRWITHSGWQPDYVLRLFRRNSAQFTEDLVHEKVTIFAGKIGQLKTPLLHHSFDSLEDVLDKVNRYSTAGAMMRHQRGQTSSLKKAIFHGLWAFFRTYVLKLGFLDGREGFMLAVSNAEGVYYRYLKLMYLSQESVK